MAYIVFFSIPAHGHTNPTLPVIRELIDRGHRVRFYSFEPLREKIEQTGAEFVPCDAYLPKAPDDLDKKVGKDFTALVAMVADTTINLDAAVCGELEQDRPDLIVSDSMCFWGKLFSKKLKIPYVCSTTTFAFNDKSAKNIKRGFGEILRTIFGMRTVNQKLRLLRDHGYPVNSLLSLITNDNDTDTIVYTSKLFQPEAESFSDRVAFVGPSVAAPEAVEPARERKRIYISLGTVMNRKTGFYRDCITAFSDAPYDVTMSVGEETDLAALGEIPQNFTVKNRVAQLAVLRGADVFISHCGMNSANESLYFGVPMVLYPQQSEEGMVANRIAELGAGVLLKDASPAGIRAAVKTVLEDARYAENAAKIAESFRAAGGPKTAADRLEAVIQKH